MRMHDVELVVGQVEVLHVPEPEHDVVLPTSRGFLPGTVQSLFGQLKRCHCARRDQLGQVSGDRAGPAADVQDGQATAQVRQ